MPYRSFILICRALFLIRAQVLRIMLHNWLTNKGPASPSGARFRRCSVPAAPLAAQLRPLLGCAAPLGRYNKMNIIYIVSKLHNCPSGGLTQPSPVAARPPWPTQIDREGSLRRESSRGGQAGGFPLRPFQRRQPLLPLSD